MGQRNANDASGATAVAATASNQMSRAELVEAWIAIYRRPPPKGLSTRLLRLAVAYDHQARQSRGLTRSARRTLQRSSRARDAGSETLADAGTATPGPGTRLVREWRGQVHVVDVLETSVLYRGETYRSLSAVARAITGARWSGPRFFGLQGR